MFNNLIGSKNISFVLFLVVWFFCGANPIFAQRENQATAHIYSLVGLASRQKAQINVVNAYPPDPISPRGQSNTVEVEIKFFDRHGNIFAHMSEQLAPGQSANRQLNFSPFDGLRLNFRPVVIVHHPQGNFNPKLVPSSLEIFDSNSGRSSLFVHPSALVGFNPQPEPPAM